MCYRFVTNSCNSDIVLINLNISFFTKQFFKNSFQPQWVGIDACFCFCAALLAGQHKNKIDRNDEFSAIDLSSRLDSYPAPTSKQLDAGNNPFASDVDQLVRGLLESGVRIRAKDEFCNLDYDYSTPYSVTESTVRDSGSYWDSERTIDYQNKQVIIHDDPEGFLRDCLHDYDYHNQTGGDCGLIKEVKSAIIDIEVFREDLLDSLQSLIETFIIKRTSKSTNTDIMEATGINRFIFSINSNNLLVEFNNKVNNYGVIRNKKQITDLHYILSHPVSNSLPNYLNQYAYVTSGGFSTDSSCINDDSVNIHSENELTIQSNAPYYDEIENTIQSTTEHINTLNGALDERPDDKDLLENIELLKTENGKLKYKSLLKANTPENKIKRKTTRSIKLAILSLNHNPGIQEHLNEYIKKDKDYIYYKSNTNWITK